MPPKALQECFVLYQSREDACWVAHGLHTDQIGTGNDVVQALASCIRAVDAVKEIAAANPGIKRYREAPPEIQKLAKGASRLPGEIFEIAHKMARGKWPEDVGLVDFRPAPARKRFIAESLQAAGA